MTAREYLQVNNPELVKQLEKHLLRGLVEKEMDNFAKQQEKEIFTAGFECGCKEAKN